MTPDVSGGPRQIYKACAQVRAMTGCVLSDADITRIAVDADLMDAHPFLVADAVRKVVER